MKSKIKTLDFMIASEIFLLAIIEFISWRFCISENYEGDVMGSYYLLFYYPLFCTLGFLIVGLTKVFKTLRFNLCAYTVIISWIFLFIQIFNLVAIFIQFGIDYYNSVIYPTFLFTIFGIIILKIIRWVSQKHS